MSFAKIFIHDDKQMLITKRDDEDSGYILRIEIDHPVVLIGVDIPCGDDEEGRNKAFNSMTQESSRDQFDAFVGMIEK